MDNGLWFCFSCNRGGNALKFCQEMGLPKKTSPDYDSKYHRYSYGGEIEKLKGKTKNLKSRWQGTKNKGLPKDLKPYNHQAIDFARENPGDPACHAP